MAQLVVEHHRPPVPEQVFREPSKSAYPRSTFGGYCGGGTWQASADGPPSPAGGAPLSEQSPETVFAGHPDAMAVYRRVLSLAQGLGPVEVRVSRSQVAFRRRTGFAYLWLPGRWLSHPTAEVVLSIALARQDGSARFKQVVHPAPKVWMHHLEVHTVADLDAEVAQWLHEAYARAE